MASIQSRKALDRARALHHKGNLAEAERLYLAELRRDAANVDALHLIGLLCAQRGDLEAARQYFDRALGLSPERPELHFLRAEVAGALGLAEQAIEGYRQALSLRQEFPEAMVNLADLLLQRGQAPDALDLLDQALRLRPDGVAVLNNRGNALQALKRHAEALHSFDAVLAKLPGHADVLNNRSSALLSLGKYADAEDSCRAALRSRPDHAFALLNLARAVGAQGRLEEALGHSEAALALRPADFDAWCERASILRELQRFPEARDSLQKALALKPDAAGAWSDLAATLLYLHQYAPALGACERAVSLQPRIAAAWSNRGLALQFLERHAEAIPAYEKALAIDPRTPYAQGRLAALKLRAGDWRGHRESTRRIIEAVDAGQGACEPFDLLFLSDVAARQLACGRTYVRDKYPVLGGSLWRGERFRHQRIKLAYVSADFGEHPSSYLLAGLFERHDRSRFEIYGISLGSADSGAAASRVAAAFEHFVRAHELSDEGIAHLLRREQIEIAVDLMGFTSRSRTGAYPLRPCPVQVGYLGFPATTGADWLDYIIADRFIAPPCADANYAEKLVRLPDTFQANDSTGRTIGPVPGRSQLDLPEDSVVYCSFNKSPKLTPAMFDVWTAVLNSVPGSVLWLWGGEPLLEDNLRREAAARGIAPARLVFARGLPYASHLARLSQADVALDTLPFNGGATTSDALWSGVPVITCPGDAFAARMSGSLLHAIGMPELVTASLDEYKSLAIRLGRDPQLLPATKRKLAANRLTHPLFDTDRFCRHLEAAYEIMWRRYQAGEPPAAFGVDAMTDARVAPA